MIEFSFANMYDELTLPVLVCWGTEKMRVKYMNKQAELLFSPTKSVDSIQKEISLGKLADLLHFATQEESTTFFSIVKNGGNFEKFPCEILTFDKQVLQVHVWGNRVGAGKDEHFVFYMRVNPKEGVESDRQGSEFSTIINASLVAPDVNSSIQTTIALAGRTINVSRVYIFEEIDETTTRNTYEWCAEGVSPAIQQLQDLKKADYNYDIIINAGMYITDDVRALPAGDREILEKQGICSLAIIPVFDHETPLGYVGFDDCAKYRKWSHSEIQFLESIAQFLATSIKRRNAESGARHSQDVMQIISDNSDDIVYVNSLEDYTLKFVSKSLLVLLDKTEESLLGKPCWAVLQKEQTGPCSFCPIPKISCAPGADRSETYVWEFKNQQTEKFYLIKDSLVPWVDGRRVHIETAIDISHRKEYEENLRYFASTDTMTGAYKREWGTVKLETNLQKTSQPASLCFIDIDGLKHTNDKYGHAAGDDLLVKSAAIIRSSLGADTLLCRWGGDEFLLWLDNPTEQAASKLQAIQSEMARYNETNKKPYQLSFSYGIVPVFPGADQTLDTLVTEADALMYVDKMKKRGKLLNRRRGD